MRRYELVEDGKSYFWEIAFVEENRFTTTEGFNGNVTRSRNWDFTSLERMRAEYRKHVDWRERAGFVVAHSDAADDQIVSTWLAELRNDVNVEIEKQIIERPDDPDAYLVYGDWLESRGSARGELVQIQAARMTTPQDLALREREGTLLAEYERPWLGELADSTAASLEWRFGFLHDVRFQCLFRDLRSQYKLLTPLTVARLLRRLRFDTYTYELERDLTIHLGDFFTANPLPSPSFLSRLDVPSPDAEMTVAKFPFDRLEHLDLSADVLRLRDEGMTKLRVLDLSFAEIDVDSSATAIFPALEELRLTMISGSRDRRGQEGTVVEPNLGMSVPPFLQILMDRSPQVTQLAVRVPAWGDDVVRSLLDRNRGQNLALLDLSGSALSDLGARLLLENIEKGDVFAEVGAFDLRFNELTPALTMELDEKLEQRVRTEGQGDRPPWLR